MFDSIETRAPTRCSFADVNPLSERESAVLALSATGLTVTEVARRLDESPLVVSHALRLAVTKLGVSSKLEAVVIALQCGLIDLPHE